MLIPTSNLILAASYTQINFSTFAFFSLLFLYCDLVPSYFIGNVNIEQEYLRSCGMHSARKDFHFCFLMNRLLLLNDVEAQLDPFTHFRIDILKNNRPLAASPEMLCSANEHAEVIINQLLFFRCGQGREGCELRLVMIGQERQERVVGKFQFVLGNYVRAYDELRRNCIELNVQISANYSLFYDVFIERTEEALQRIIREHQAANRFNMHTDKFSEIDSFLPHQIINPNLEEIYRDIRIDEASPLLFHQRFWSPKRSRLASARKQSNLSKTSDRALQTAENSLLTDANRVSLVKISKSLSTYSDLELLKMRNPNGSFLDIAELDIESQPETDDQRKQFFELYEVIRSESKIVQPDELELQSERERAKQCREREAEKQKRAKKSLLSKYQNPIKYVILCIILITIIGFFLFLFDTPTLKMVKVKKRRGQKVSHKRQRYNF